MKILLFLFTLLISTFAFADTVELTFVPPVEREDGTQLSPDEIAGFRIYWGARAGDYQNTIPLNADVTSYTTEEFPLGSTFAVMTTIDTDGRESVYSPEISWRLKHNPKPPSQPSVRIIIN